MITKCSDIKSPIAQRSRRPRPWSRYPGRSRRGAGSIERIAARSLLRRSLVGEIPRPVDDLPGALGAAVAADLPGVRFLDLTPRFRAEAAAGALLYLADDNHWSPRGHRVAAEELASVLRPTARVVRAVDTYRCASCERGP